MINERSPNFFSVSLRRFQNHGSCRAPGTRRRSRARAFFCTASCPPHRRRQLQDLRRSPLLLWTRRRPAPRPTAAGHRAPRQLPWPHRQRSLTWLSPRTRGRSALRRQPRQSAKRRASPGRETAAAFIRRRKAAPGACSETAPYGWTRLTTLTLVRTDASPETATAWPSASRLTSPYTVSSIGARQPGNVVYNILYTYT